MSMDLDKQTEIFDRKSEECLAKLYTFISEHEDDILSMARDRLVDGYSKYGEKMWMMDTKERRYNILEEIADAVNYMVSGA